MRKTIILVLGMALASLVWLGCGVDDEHPRQRLTNPGAGSPLSSMSVEERKVATSHQDAKAVEIFVRVDGSAGDPTSDYRACREKLLEDRKFVNTSALSRTLMLVNCMSTKGWQPKDSDDGGAGANSGQ